MTGYADAITPMLWGSLGSRWRRGPAASGGARFSYDGVDVRAAGRRCRPHAIHGTVYESDRGPSSTTAPTGSPLDALFASTSAPGRSAGTPTQHFELHDDHLAMTLAVIAGDRSMPAEVGWHPWFPHRTRDLVAEAMYERDVDGLPTGR